MIEFLIFINSKLIYPFLGVLIIVLVLKYRLKYNQIYNKLLKKLQEAEIIMDKYKISNHETKNQLLMIRNMLEKNSINDTKKYIDKIIENDYQDDEALLIESAKIPSGGIRSLIYSKLIHMKNNNIKFNLEIDYKLRFIELKEELILDICKIIGVFLDNAIEEILRIKKGVIEIKLYLFEERLNILISNTFENTIDLEKISNNRYTTKIGYRGYGLFIVKEIVRKNQNLENIRVIENHTFIQILKVNL